MVSVFLELQARLAKAKVVHPKKKDALLRKRIEKDKAKDQQAKLDQRVYNLRNDLVLAETQAEVNRQRVLVLQSEWQALYDQAGEETDEKVEKQLSQGDLESDGMEATDDERVPLGDSDGFLTVLSRHGRKKQRREAAQDDQGERDQEEILRPPHPPQPSSDVMDRWTPVRCVSTCLTVSLQNSLRVRCKVWLPVCFRPLRERPMCVVFWMRRREELCRSLRATRVMGGGRVACPGRLLARSR